MLIGIQRVALINILVIIFFNFIVSNNNYWYFYILLSIRGYILIVFLWLQIIPNNLNWNTGSFHLNNHTRSDQNIPAQFDLACQPVLVAVGNTVSNITSQVTDCLLIVWRQLLNEFRIIVRRNTARMVSAVQARIFLNIWSLSTFFTSQEQVPLKRRSFHTIEWIK